MPKRLRRPADPRYTLTELEDHDWGPAADDSHLATTLHALRRKPVGQFTIEDLRLALGQSMSVAILLPLALQHLELDPLVSGDFYAGDLLKNAVGCMDKWGKDEEQRARMRAVLARALQLLHAQPDAIDSRLAANLRSEFGTALQALDRAALG